MAPWALPASRMRGYQATFERYLKRRHFSIVQMTYSLRNKHCSHEFYVISTSNENTHTVIFEDTIQKPILICDSCASL